MMNEEVALNELMDNPAVRRLWLLHRALQSLPLDRAIELARTAEAFVIGALVENQGADPPELEALVAQGLETIEQPINELSSSNRSGEEPTATKRTRLILPTQLRDRLLARLAEGAKNAELAAEFGLASKQVQGIRMGCARELAKRREQLSTKLPYPDQCPAQTASVEEIIRYLRQQDDVVVPQENGDFLVNGRFQMPLGDLVARANRMRGRQRKPEFEMTDAKTVRSEEVSSADGHPLFWKESTPAQPRS